MIKSLEDLKKTFKNKKVFVTGHTGFKGSWLCIFLDLLGAKVTGYALKPKGKINFFNLAGINKIIARSIIGDVRDYSKLKKSITNCRPDFIVHMAAQSIVRYSYVNPKLTYETNTLGTLNILNIIYELNFIKNVLIITTDKVYENMNNRFSYKESSRLGGLDPYSNSKACAELISKSYNNSFFKKNKIFLATARSGNIIGGGDFSKDRIVPDFFRSFRSRKIFLRSPNSIRPWQHVIEPLYGYILLLLKLNNKEKFSNQSWNFGPNNQSKHKSVLDIINLINKEFNNNIKIIKNKKNYAQTYLETKFLTLNSLKAKKILKWKTKYNIKDVIKLTSNWQKNFLEGCDMLKFSRKQILDYFN